MVTKFINGVMLKGKKSIAESLFYGAMEKVVEKTGEEALKVFKKAIDNADYFLFNRSVIAELKYLEKKLNIFNVFKNKFILNSFAFDAIILSL